jgi:hypothetical protein
MSLIQSNIQFVFSLSSVLFCAGPKKVLRVMAIVAKAWANSPLLRNIPRQKYTLQTKHYQNRNLKKEQLAE